MKLHWYRKNTKNMKKITLAWTSHYTKSGTHVQTAGNKTVNVGMN